MGKRRLPVAPTIIAAYRDLARLLAAMPVLMGSAFVIIVAVSAGAELVPQRLWDQELVGEVLGLAQNAVEAFLLTPIVIAIQRFVILDKITQNYTVPVGDTVFGVFFGWLFALKVLIGLPFDILGLLQALDWSFSASTLAFAVAMIAAVTVVLRLAILLPGLAVGAPGATASRALADSKGSAHPRRSFPGTGAVGCRQFRRRHLVGPWGDDHRLPARDARFGDERRAANDHAFAYGSDRLVRLHGARRTGQARRA